MQITLQDGYKVNVTENIQNDWNFLSTLRKIDKGESSLIVDVAEIILGGEDEVNKLAKHLEKDGVTSIESMVSAITEIMESVKELKNS